MGVTVRKVLDCERECKRRRRQMARGQLGGGVRERGGNDWHGLPGPRRRAVSFLPGPKR